MVISPWCRVRIKLNQSTETCALCTFIVVWGTKLLELANFFADIAETSSYSYETSTDICQRVRSVIGEIETNLFENCFHIKLVRISTAYMLNRRKL